MSRRRCLAGAARVCGARRRRPLWVEVLVDVGGTATTIAIGYTLVSLLAIGFIVFVARSTTGRAAQGVIDVERLRETEKTWFVIVVVPARSRSSSRRSSSRRTAAVPAATRRWSRWRRCSSRGCCPTRPLEGEPRGRVPAHLEGREPQLRGLHGGREAALPGAGHAGRDAEVRLHLQAAGHVPGALPRVLRRRPRRDAERVAGRWREHDVRRRGAERAARPGPRARPLRAR